VTFALLHLLPVRLCLFEAGLVRRLAGERAARFSTLVPFLLLSDVLALAPAPCTG
jgi:hypothetical protein